MPVLNGRVRTRRYPFIYLINVTKPRLEGQHSRQCCSNIFKYCKFILYAFVCSCDKGILLSTFTVVTVNDFPFFVMVHDCMLQQKCHLV